MRTTSGTVVGRHTGAENKAPMSEPPKRTSGHLVASPSKTVLEIAAKAALDAAAPGGSALVDLMKARTEALRDADRREKELRYEALYSELFLGERRLEPDVARAFLDHADFHVLLRACLADIESEKVRAYAGLARTLATSTLEKQWRRHFVLSLRDLSADELERLRKAYVARSTRLIPAQGPSVSESDFLRSGQPGSHESIMSANLAARGFIHEARLSDLGVLFTKSCWPENDLTPASIGFEAWSDVNVTIVCYELDAQEMNGLAVDLQEELRRFRIKSNIVAINRDNAQGIRLFATTAVLLIGERTERITASAEALSAFTHKVPTVALQVTTAEIPPGGIRTKAVIMGYGRPRNEVLDEVRAAVIGLQNPAARSHV